MPPAGLVGHPDHDALLAVVIADPDSDTSRLIYADYLEETGDEPDAARAEFIRLQCSIAQRERTARVAEGDAEWERAAELADDYGHEWRRRMPAVGGVVWGFGGRGGVGSAWRGFPEVVFEAPSVVRREWEIVRAVAPMGCVGLATLGQWALWTQFAASPTSPYRVARLPLTQPQAAEYFAELLGRRGVRAWRGLSVSGAGRESLIRIAECPSLGALEWLRLLALPGQERGADSLAPLVGSPHLVNLAWVEIRTHLGAPLSHREVAR